ncbi:MFS transporter [Castellaniella caeni]
MNSPSSEQAIDSKNLRKSVIAGTIGVFVHWFDWAIYAYLSGTLAHVFFPDQDGTAAMLAVWGVFAISFAVRPVGALLFGYLGDKIGRSHTLSIVIVAMAFGTLVLGLLPGYAVIGIWAPLLLLVSRVIQGLAAGGEYGSAAAFMAEYSPRAHRGFGVSWIEVGSLLGFLAASVVAFALSESMSAAQVADWGWRVPFILAAPLGIIGYYIRARIEDTPEFRSIKKAEAISQSPIREVLKSNWRQVLQASGIEMAMNVTFYIVLVYLLTYQESHLSWTAGRAALLSSVVSVIAMAVVPIAGALSDRIGRKPVLAMPCVALVVLSYPLFQLMQMPDAWAQNLSTILLGVILAMILGVHAVICAELFPTRTRQTGLSIAYQVTAAIFTGTVPYVLTWFIARTGDIMYPAYYLIVMGVVGVVVTLTLKETRGSSLLHEVDLIAVRVQNPATAPVPNAQLALDEA